MKQLFLFLLILISSQFSIAQVVVPSKVKKAFLENHQSVDQAFWEMREGAYVAMFSDDEGLKKVFYNAEGNWLETRIRMEQEALPLGVQEFIFKHYEAADKTYTGKVVRSQQILYRVESELADAIVIKLLDEAGNLQEEERIELGLLTPLKIEAYPLSAKPIQPIISREK